MELRDVNVGNYVKESEFSSRDRVHSDYYAIEFRDLGYHKFMKPIPIDHDWCVNLGFEMLQRTHSSGNYDWIAEKGSLSIVAFEGDIIVRFRTGGTMSLLENIKYVHQLQNFYYLWYGEDLTITK